jgi:hypothetical protein
MKSDDGRKYGSMELLQGGAVRPRYRALVVTTFTTADFDLDSDMKDLFVAMEGEDGSVPSRAIQEIREGRQRPWRYLARRGCEAINAGTPLSRLYDMTHRLNQYFAQKAAARRAPRRRLSA